MESRRRRGVRSQPYVIVKSARRDRGVRIGLTLGRVTVIADLATGGGSEPPVLALLLDMRDLMRQQCLVGRRASRGDLVPIAAPRAATSPSSLRPG